MRRLIPAVLIGLVIGMDGQQAAVQSAARAPTSIGAIGHIVPASGVAGIFGPPGARVLSLHARTGQQVKAGAVLMTLQSSSATEDPGLTKLQLDAARQLSEQQVAAQNAVLRLASARKDEADTALRAYQSLDPHLVSQKELTRLLDAANEAKLALDVEQTKLRLIATQSRSALQEAQRQFELAERGSKVVAPFDGTIIKVNRQAGDQLTNEPAIEIADLKNMYVLCDVFEGDLLALKPGMKATIKAQPLPAPLTGRVEEVGNTVDGRTRLGEVRVRLDRPDPADRLIGMEVQVAIEH